MTQADNFQREQAGVTEKEITDVLNMQAMQEVLHGI